MSNTKLSLKEKFESLPQYSNRNSFHTKVSVTARSNINDVPSEAKEFQLLREQVKQLKQMILMQQKEILKLKEMNKYLLLSNKQKADAIDSERRIQHPIVPQGSNPPQRRASINTSLTRSQAQSPDLKRKTNIRNTMIPIRFAIDDYDSNSKQQNAQQKEKEKHVQYILSFLQAEEYFKINTILNMNLKDSEAISLYDNDGTIMLIDNLLREEELFVDIINATTPQQISFIYDKLVKFQGEHRQLFTMVLRLKKILQGALQINQSVLLEDAISTIMDQIMQCLDCDRASCFMVDPQSNELWSSTSKGTQQIVRMAIGKGIAGHCAQQRQIINIQNAYVDNRFNSEVDVKTNYKTRTVLACPILERDRCIGVLQCVNKYSGHFNNDDEALLTILAEFSRTVLTNAINHDEEVLIKNKLRYSVKTGIIFSRLLKSRKQLLLKAQERLKALMGVDTARIVIYNEALSQLSFYNEDMTLNTVSANRGILGEVITSRKMVNTYICYTHPNFNPTVDLPTSLPIIAMPIIDDDVVLGAIQVANTRGASSVFQSSSPKITTIDMEILEYFVSQVAEALLLSANS